MLKAGCCLPRIHVVCPVSLALSPSTLEPTLSRAHSMIDTLRTLHLAARLPLVIFLLAAFCLAAPRARAVTITWVTVGDAGNAADVATISGNNFGSVAYEYQIGKYNVTNSEYVEFLNAKATVGDSLGLFNPDMEATTWGGIVRTGSGTVGDPWSYSVKPTAVGQGPGGSDYGYENKPVVYVSWFDSIRFANWMENGQGSGDTETGSYTLTGGTPVPTNANSIARDPGGEIFINSVDEWYKAAFYDPNKPGGAGYWDYPTGTDTPPDNNLPSADSGNSANFGGAGSPSRWPYPFTDVGAYVLSESPYGTADQGGLVYEWNEGLVGTSFRRIWGGGWNEASSIHQKSDDDTHYHTGDREAANLGFRLASLPTFGGPTCVIGDADCDGDVDIAGDILPAFTNFTGPGSFGKVRADGDVHGDGSGATSNLDPHDGDVDVSDLLTMFGAFTGPLDEGEGGLGGPAAAGDPNIPDLIYDATTGEVVLDSDGSSIIGYSLQNATNSFLPGAHTPILAGVTTALTSQIEEAALAPGSGSIGLVFPTGLDLAGLSALLTVNQVSRSLGAPLVPFDLVVVGGATVPEPATLLLAILGWSLLLASRRRRVIC
ncbi:MAG: hypothetical protein DWQ46_00500 [Planctomycetota bacterium]|nr:MAG: hypothetical protein DWQ46_00500 [Planctomycetota bacterium]